MFVKMALKQIACTGIQCMSPLLELFMGQMHLYQVLPFNSINIPGEHTISISIVHGGEFTGSIRLVSAQQRKFPEIIRWTTFITIHDKYGSAVRHIHNHF